MFKYPTGAIGEVFLTILSQLLIILQIFLSVNVFIAYSWQFFIFIFRALIYLNRYILLIERQKKYQSPLTILLIIKIEETSLEKVGVTGFEPATS